MKRDKLKAILIKYNECYFSDFQIDKIFESEYNRQAIDFLFETKTQISIESKGQSKASWTNANVNQYEVTLKNQKHEYSFDYYDSIYNTEKNKSSKYDFYSAIACLDSYVSDSFDEFCLDFGYEFKNESEYIKAKSTHLACIEQSKNLKKLFTSEQLERLSEIR